MKHGDGMSLGQASKMCQSLIDLLTPGCKSGYCREAGSIRRMKTRPNDIEIVCVPILRSTPQGKIINDLDMLCENLLRQGVLEKRPDKNGRAAWGSKLKRAIFYQGEQYASLDLFAVLGKASWGVIYAIRTGPGDFNRLLVTSQRYGGACPLDRKVAGGRVWDISNLSLEPGRQEAATAMPSAKFVRLAEGVQLPEIATPKESDFFTALGVPLWQPRLRTVQTLKKYLHERSLKTHIAGGQHAT